MCVAEQRDRVREVAARLDERDGVIAIDVHPPGSGPLPKWSMEVLLQRGGVPSAVLTQLGTHGMELRASRQIGPHWRFVALAE